MKTERNTGRAAEAGVATLQATDHYFQPLAAGMASAINGTGGVYAEGRYGDLETGAHHPARHARRVVRSVEEGVMRKTQPAPLNTPPQCYCSSLSSGRCDFCTGLRTNAGRSERYAIICPACAVTVERTDDPALAEEIRKAAEHADADPAEQPYVLDADAS